ncbi:hypothetical protein [Porphyrobacter sp. ULC335]|uniref:hypothetical protein n=1 Tax=Porphyrobacter sp. ULC335 TaxID=2854260 RepID=UPI0022203EF4|nr:hypothetical protein [Porphyrobacter sp. ULC335]UYV14312.1 hypothetical protein KVF90_08945 [Porphyrobacter sp. ULC335]
MAFRLIRFAVLIQLPALLLFFLNALTFVVGMQLAVSAICLAGLVLAHRLYVNGNEAAGLGLIAATLLLTIGFWYAVFSGRLI